MHNLEKTKAVSWLNKQVQGLKIKLKVDEITSSDEKPPHEELVLQLFAATEDQVQYPLVMEDFKKLLIANCNNDWKIAVKTLAVIHRLVTERRHPSFTYFRLHSSYHITALKTMCLFDDQSSPLATECTIWVRAYSYYLFSRLQCNRIFTYDIVAENQNTKIEDLGIGKLLKYLPFLQRLLGCLLDCAPKGSQVAFNSLIQYALRLLVKDCPNIYGAINACQGKLLDSFFSMPRDKAIRVVYIYKQNIQQFKGISCFNKACRAVLSSASNDFPSSSEPSESLLAEMEDYIKNGNGELSKTADKEDHEDSGKSDWDWEETWD